MQLKPQIIIAAALAAALLAVSPAASAPATPTPVGPPSGTAVDALPTFGWNAVAGADKYEFQLAGDPAFNSPIASFQTKNTRATFKEAQPNGTYYWRVRAVDSAGGVSPWSATWNIVKSWTAAPTPTSPTDGASLAYPTQPLTLKWTAAQRASKYLVWIATDPALSNLIVGSPEEDTQGIEYTPNGVLTPGTFYWAVTPVDARGNRGTRSQVWSFTRTWNSASTPTLTDLASATELFDPQFSWTAVPGAERYEVEVNSSSDFATGSKVCCSGTALGTSLSPTEVFANNNYYWWMRALDPAGNAGQWNAWNGGAPFTKSFDNVTPSIVNLRMRQPRRSGHGRRRSRCGVPDEHSDRNVGSRPRRDLLSGRGDAVELTHHRLRLDGVHDPALGLDHRRQRVDAPRRRLERRQAFLAGRRLTERLLRHARPDRRPGVLRARAGAEWTCFVGDDRLRAVHLSQRQRQRRFRMGRVPHRGRLHAVLRE